MIKQNVIFINFDMSMFSLVRIDETWKTYTEIIT